MVNLTEKQQDEFYDVVGRLGTIRGCAEFGQKYNIPSILLEARLRQVKRLAKKARLVKRPSHMPRKAQVADDDELEQYEQRADQLLEKSRMKRVVKPWKLKFKDIVDVRALTKFCKLYMKNEEAGFERPVQKQMCEYVKDFMNEILLSLRTAVAEYARIHFPMPKKNYLVKVADVERLLKMRGDSLRVSQEAADVLEEIPVFKKFTEHVDGIEDRRTTDVKEKMRLRKMNGLLHN